MTTSNTFLSPEEFFDTLIAQLPKVDQEAYASMKHTRIEPAYRGRKFIIYKMVGRNAQKLATLSVVDFVCDDEKGASIQLEWLEQPGKMLIIGYTPVKLWDFPVFLHLPVNNKLRWGAKRGKESTPSLSFLTVVHTESRLHLRERDVIYMETTASFQDEFFPIESA